jgi:phage terminase large subunit GpA-like protein
VLSPESSASPGPWRTSAAPYLREIQDAMGDPQTETIVFWKSAQIGGTEALINTLLHELVNDPGPLLVLQPTLEMATAFSKDRLAPAIRDCAVVRALIGAPRTRDTDNAILRKGSPGAVVTIAGSNSPASLASRPIRVLLADEIDRYERSVGKKGKDEGDPLALAIRRTAAFRRRKIFLTSTPSVANASRIQDWWAVSDQRGYHTPCPRCGMGFAIEWQHVRWTEHEPASAWLECPHCAGRIEDRERPAMLAAGTWVPAAPFSGVRGYRAWEVHAPWRSLATIVTSFLVAKRSIETLHEWRNNCVAELWEEPGERVEASHLLVRREAYAAEVPAGVVYITAAADVQDNYVAALVVGWGVGEESWILHYENLPGDPARPEVWAALDALLQRPWRHASGLELRISCALIDSGGHRTQSVYSYVLPRQPRRVFACKGGRTHGLLVSPAHPVKPQSGPGTVQLRYVDPDQTKSLIYSRLRLSEPGPEYVHFPMSVGETFFNELTAETLRTTRNKYGIPVKQWQQVRSRNEALDAFGYALAALRIIAPAPRSLEVAAAQIATAVAARSMPPAPPAVESAGDPADPPAPLSPAGSTTGRRVYRSRYLDAHRLPSRERW